MNILEEYVSHNLNYKAIVVKAGDAYEVNVYHWNEEALDDSGRPTWERLAGPFPVENLPAAEALAQTQLADLAGESVDNEVDERVTELIESILGHQDFAFLVLENYTTTCLKDPDSDDFEPLKSHKIMITGEFYYVLDDEGLWWSGFLYDEGQVRCWQKFATLKEALLATK